MKPLEAGSVIGRRYRLERELAQQGGMGVVWTAVHLVTKRRVAVKLLRAGGYDDAASRARLLREARASCAVDHPNVLPVLDVIDAEGAPALVMELLEGESLRERLERTGALGARETCALLAPVAAALAAAHAARVVHRDIKPENIFLVRAAGGEPTVKVLDFGIAKIVATEEPTTNLTESGAMLGTPYYMAPEQVFGERDVGPPADAWALGIVLYECLNGVRPTQGENLGQVIKRITREPMVPVEESVAGVPAELASLVGRLLQRDAAAREIDMARVATTLAACAEEPAEGANAEPATPAAQGASRGPRLVLGALFVTVAAFVVVSVVGPGRASRPSAEAIAAAASTAVAAPDAPPPPPPPPPSVTVEPPAVSARPAASATPAPSRHVVRTQAVDAAVARPAASAPGAVHDAGTTGPGHVIIDNPF